ncbi:GntR family transcriptional regulator [Rhizobium sp. KAs_5_22]|uniref:GntR family transcriptional regulator n=1 Tax=Ciceribacter selenitireducens TaxID=448181 RepID=UPI00048D224E|nr:GntR family transcriptional regulator [Ciceribacter selenitireducens]PPJ48392.1 GntR family transcriptional regulator [Rhizobium sp. KAs_5_22]
MPVPPTEAAALEQSSAVGPQLYRLLRDRIVRGDLAPGARISESEIAASYKVSRQPVREAFIKLAEESLVEVRPQRGTYVRRISVPAVMTARFVREAVEADIVREAARRMTPDMLTALEANLSAQRTVVDGDDPSRFMELDEAFHRQLAEAAGQPAIWDILEDLKTQMDRVRHLSARQFPRERLIDQHAAVVAALRSGDPQVAEAEMRTHLRGVLTDLPAIAEAMPEFFDEAGG